MGYIGVDGPIDRDGQMVCALVDVLLSHGVTWDGVASLDEVESMYLGLLVSLGDDLCE